MFVLYYSSDKCLINAWILFQGTETKSIYMGEDGVFDFDKPLVPDQEDEDRLKDNLGGLFGHLNE